MNTRTTREWMLLLLAGATPFVGVAMVRHITGAAGPASAHAATEVDAFDDDQDEQESLHIVDRAVVVPPSEATRLFSVAASDIASWATPLFTPVATEHPEAPSPTPAPTTTTPVAPSFDAYADRFRLSSLMATRSGAVAVIDRKLRRVGEDIGSGVVIHSIDLENRIVHLRAPDGALLDRRPSR